MSERMWDAGTTATPSRADDQRSSARRESAASVNRSTLRQVSVGVHPGLRAVFHSLDQNGVSWCCLPDPTGLSAADSGADLLVESGSSPRVSLILAKHRFLEVRPSDRSFRMFVAYHRQTDQWLEVRLRGVLAFGDNNQIFTDCAAAALARRQALGGVFVLHPSDLFWLQLTRALLAGGRPGSHVQALAREARIDGPLAAWLGDNCPAGWTLHSVLDAARCGHWDTAARFGKAFVESWRRSHRFDAAKSRLAAVVFAVRATLPRRRGVSVALLGPDGCGKSTLAAHLIEHSYFPCRSLYMGLWRQRQRPRLRDRLPGWSSASRLSTVWQKYLSGQLGVMLGRLVIFDRYTYDARSCSSHGSLLETACCWVIGHSCPAPDLVLFLDVPGRLMHDRKGESTPVELEKQRQGFLALRKDIPQLVVLDATMPIDSVRTAASDLIWELYLGKS